MWEVAVACFHLRLEIWVQKVVSFDFDEASVWCTSELKKRYYDGDETWTVMQGSVLDNAFSTHLENLIMFTAGVSCITLAKCGEL